jgi:hypothetical protein
MLRSKRSGATGIRVKRLTNELKQQVASSRERLQVLAMVGFDPDAEPTPEELAKKSIHALGVAIDCIITALLTGEVTFKTGEGAVSSLVQAAKLRSQLVTKAGLNGQGVDEDYLEDEQDRLRKATGEVLNFIKVARSRDKRKVQN